MSAEIAVATEYHDNLALSSVSRDRTWVGTLGPKLEVRSTDAPSSLRGGAAWEARAYSLDSRLNTVNHVYHVAADGRSERFSGGAAGRVTLDTTLDSELEETGIVLARRGRVSRVAEGSLSYALTERTETGVTYGYTSTTYEGDLVDYDGHDVRWRGTSVVSSRGDRLGVALGTSSFATESALRSRGLSAGVDYTRRLSERMTLAIDAGVQRTSLREGAGGRAIDRGVVGGLRLTQTGERGALSLDLSRSVRPSGTGVLLETTRGGIRADYAATARVTAIFQVDGTWSAAIGVSGEERHARVIRIQPRLDWRIFESLTAGAAYTHWRSRGEGGAATAHVAMARLTYRWRGTEG